jgi:fluoroquinolone transport system permease protein
MTPLGCSWKPLVRSFVIFVRQILSDKMLWAVCIGPIFTGALFRFGVPYAETLLAAEFHRPILADYYLLFDLFLSLITPYMFCFASSMVMLTEYDDNLTVYLSVTPVRKSGYLLSRLAFPAIVSFLVSVPVMFAFALTAWPLRLLLIVCLYNSALTVAVSMLVFSFSRNRVEGMAMAKTAGLFMIGLITPFFVESRAQYLLSPLPSFWVTKLCAERNALFLIPAVLTLAAWGSFLWTRFRRKLA